MDAHAAACSAPTAFAGWPTPTSTAELALGPVAVAAAHVLGECRRAFDGAARGTGRSPSSGATRGPPGSSSRPRSSPGWLSAGVDVLDVGVLPTPAVAFLTADLGADLGVMLSASHNPMPDNGIKFFARGGLKLPRRARGRDRGRGSASRGSARSAPPSAGSRDVRRRPSATSSPASARVPHRLDGLQSSSTAPTARPPWSRPRRCAGAGADVIAIGAEPDGLNINDGCRLDPPRASCSRRSSSTAPTSASPTTATPTAAWRSTPTARSSTATRSWRSSRSPCATPAQLTDDTVVATVMSNLGLQARDGARRASTWSRPRSATATCSRRCARAATPSAASSPATSIMPDHATTGDGILTALHLLARMAETGQLAGRAGRR